MCLSLCSSSCYHSTLFINHSIASKVYRDTSYSSILITGDLSLTYVISITMLKSIKYWSLYTTSDHWFITVQRHILQSISWMSSITTLLRPLSLGQGHHIFQCQWNNTTQTTMTMNTHWTMVEYQGTPNMSEGEHMTAYRQPNRSEGEHMTAYMQPNMDWEEVVRWKGDLNWLYAECIRMDCTHRTSTSCLKLLCLKLTMTVSASRGPSLPISQTYGASARQQSHNPIISCILA